MTEFNKMQTVKRRFFAMRNGAVADILRKGGAPYRVIFGLLLPQIADIAREIGYDEELAFKLRENVSTRESLLLWPMIVDPAGVTPEMGKEMVGEVVSTEAADVLCHKLLRNIPQAFNLAVSLVDSDEPVSRYCAMRILWPFVYTRPSEVKPLAQRELLRNSQLTAPLARQIIEEIEFMAPQES